MDQRPDGNGRLVDLTLPVTQGMPVYPGDPPVRVSEALTIAGDGASVHDVSLGTHTGTHIDVPSHMIDGADAVDSLSVLDACIGDACVLDCREYMSGGEITVDVLDCLRDFDGPCLRVLLATGWGERFASADYYDAYPGVSPALADGLVALGIRLVGVETPSLHTELGQEVHLRLFRAGIVVIESLGNLCDLKGRRVWLSAAPLKLCGLDGSPVRACAVVFD